MAIPRYKLHFIQGELKYTSPHTEREHVITRAHSFEFVGLLALRALEGGNGGVKLAEVEQLVQLRRASVGHTKSRVGRQRVVGQARITRIQANQIQRLVTNLTTSFHFPIEIPAKQLAGPWHFARGTLIDVFVDNKLATLTTLRKALGYAADDPLWGDSIPPIVPDPSVIENLAAQIVELQILHGQAKENAPGLRPRDADPDFWLDDEVILFFTALLGSVGLGNNGNKKFQGLRRLVTVQVSQRREAKLASIKNAWKEKWKYYAEPREVATFSIRSATTSIAGRALRLAAMSNEMRALRRAGDMQTAQLRMDEIATQCRDYPHDDPDGYITCSMQIERAWVAYLRADSEEGYLMCERELIQLSNSSGPASGDGRLKLEFHLLAALCARRRAFLPAQSPSLAKNWVAHAFRHFNAALRLCLLTEDRELQVHTIATIGDALWDFGSQNHNLLSDWSADYQDRDVLALASLRIVGSAIRLARLGGANSGQYYALSYVLKIVGESRLTDDHWRTSGFTYLGIEVTMDRIFEVANRTLEIPGLSLEASARLQYGLALVEYRCGSKDKAYRIVMGLLEQAEGRYSQRLRVRIRALALDWNLSSSEYKLIPTTPLQQA